MTESFHKPVLVSKIMDYILARPRQVVADCTLGDGGHTDAVLSRTKDTFVVGMDVDNEALAVARHRLGGLHPGRFVAVKGDYRELPTVLAKLGIPGIDAALFDLGVSTRQLSTPERGFSYWEEEPIDMRMDQERALTAKDILENSGEDELTRILRDYGEERFAPQIARTIIRAREERQLNTGKDLADVIMRAYPPAARRGGPHPARRTFQALRIATNDELSRLGTSLERAFHLLRPGGIIAVLTYHSLEDRIAKSVFAEIVERGLAQKVQKKPETASEEEIAENAHARSAKLRVVERTSRQEVSGGVLHD